MDAFYGKEAFGIEIRKGSEIASRKSSRKSLYRQTVIYSIHFQVLNYRFIAGFADCHFARAGNILQITEY